MTNTELSAELKKMRDKYQNEMQETKKVKKNNYWLSSQLTKHSELLSKAKEIKANMNAELSDLKSELCTLNKKLANLEAEKAELEQRAGDLLQKDELQLNCSLNDSNQADSTMMNEEKDRRIESLRIELAEVITENQQLKRKLNKIMTNSK